MMVRAAKSTDLPVVHAVIESAYRGDTARQGWTHEADLLGGQRTDLATLVSTLGDPDQRILVLERDGSIIGTVHIQSKGNGLTYLGQLAVAPAHQAIGLGRALIDAAEDLATTQFNARTIEMTVITQRPELIAYYARRGFLPTGEIRPFPHGDDRFGKRQTHDLTFTVLAKALR